MKLTTKYNIKPYTNTPSLPIKTNPYLINPIIIGYVEDGVKKKKRSVIQATCNCGKTILTRMSHYSKLKSCGCRLSRKSTNTFTYDKYVPYVDSLSNKFNMYLKRAKSRGIEFAITLEDFKNLISNPCTYCQYSETGVDRIDNSLGYVKGNVTSCCKYCNRAKHEESEENFLKWLNHVKALSATM